VGKCSFPLHRHLWEANNGKETTLVDEGGEEQDIGPDQKAGREGKKAGAKGGGTKKKAHKATLREEKAH